MLPWLATLLYISVMRFAHITGITASQIKLTSVRFIYWFRRHIWNYVRGFALNIWWLATNAPGEEKRDANWITLRQERVLLIAYALLLKGVCMLCGRPSTIDAGPFRRSWCDHCWKKHCGDRPKRQQ